MVKSLILCEGGDDEAFLNIFLKALNIDKRKLNLEQLDNKSNFFKIETYKSKKIIEEIENELYHKVLFIFDSDYEKDNAKTGGFVNSEREIRKMIKEIKDEVGFDFFTDYYIMCDPITKDGNLEHLILSTLDKDPKACMENLLSCIKPYHTDSNKKILITGYKTIFKEPLYNFSHPNFTLLKEKLIRL